MENSIFSPSPPLLDDLTWRPITADDLEALAELADQCRQVDGGLAWMNKPDNLRGRYFPDAPGVGLGAFTTDGSLVACATVHLAGRSDSGRAQIAGQVHPQRRASGIGTYLMRWSQAQAQALFTPSTSGRRLLQIATESLTEPARRLYRAHGFGPVREDLVMRRDLQRPLPERSLPPGVKLAVWQPEVVDQFFQVYDASFRNNPGFPGYSAEEWITDRLEDQDFVPEWSLLAQEGDGPVGFLTAGTMHPSGFVIQIGVIPRQRRRGIGSALLVETMRLMQAAGETATQLTVNVNYAGAIEAYARLDFVTIGRRGRFERFAD